MLFRYLSILFLLLSSLFITGCDDSGVYQSKGDYISGYATFVNTNYLTTGGFYGVALYSSEGSPYSSIPLVVDSLQMSTHINPYHFRIYYEENKSCYLAIVWKRTNYSSEIPAVLGSFGCDTAYNCHNYKVISFPNYTGANYDITCWSDTSHIR